MKDRFGADQPGKVCTDSSEPKRDEQQCSPSGRAARVYWYVDGGDFNPRWFRRFVGRGVDARCARGFVAGGRLVRERACEGVDVRRLYAFHSQLSAQTRATASGSEELLLKYYHFFLGAALKKIRNTLVHLGIAKC
jgi:hypothetical protein